MSDNPLRFTRILLDKIWRVAMKIDGKIKHEKQQNDSDRAAAKISALSSRKIGKYEFFFSGEIILLFEQWTIKWNLLVLGQVAILTLMLKTMIIKMLN